MHPLRHRNRMYVAVLLCVALLCRGFSARAFEAVRPGAQAPTAPAKEDPVQLVMSSRMIFPHSLASAVANIQNPVNSLFPMRYSLLVDAAEVARVAGIADLPEGAITLWTSPEIAPGEGVESITLQPLPGGIPLPQGNYQGIMRVEPNQPDQQKTNYEVAIGIQVMADSCVATADATGILSLPYYNGTDAPARYSLMISALQLQTQARLTQYDNPSDVLSAKDTLLPISLSPVLAPHSASAEPALLSALPDGTSLPAGEYTLWLLRLPEGGSAPYACSRIALTVVTQSGAPSPVNLPMDVASATAYAQAVANGEFLLAQ